MKSFNTLPRTEVLRRCKAHPRALFLQCLHFFDALIVHLVYIVYLLHCKIVCSVQTFHLMTDNLVIYKFLISRHFWRRDYFVSKFYPKSLQWMYELLVLLPDLRYRRPSFLWTITTFQIIHSVKTLRKTTCEFTRV